MGTEITLSEADQELVLTHAIKIIEACDTLNMPNRQVLQDHSRYKLHIHGAGAEVALARYLGIDPQLNYRSSYSDERRPDIILGDLTIEVKSPFTKTGKENLFIPHWLATQSAPTYFALVPGNFPTYEIIGWFPGEKIFHPARLKDIYASGRLQPTYVARRDEMRPLPNNIKELLQCA